MARNTNFPEMERYFRANFDEEGYNLPYDLEVMTSYALAVYDSQGMNCEYNIGKFPNKTERVADWMMGLPTPFHPDYSNYEIEQILRDWGIIKENDIPSKVNRLVKGWWIYWADWVLKNAEGKRL